MPSNLDRAIIRQLAGETAGIAALPIQEETRRLWRKLNGPHTERPMVAIDQVCWNEMNVNDDLTLTCEDPECRHSHAAVPVAAPQNPDQDSRSWAIRVEGDGHP